MMAPTIPGKRDTFSSILSPWVVLEAGMTKVWTMLFAVTTPTSLPNSTIGMWLKPLLSMRLRAKAIFSSVSKERTGLRISSFAGVVESSRASHIERNRSSWEIIPTTFSSSTTGNARILFLISTSATSMKEALGDTDPVVLQTLSTLVLAGWSTSRRSLRVTIPTAPPDSTAAS